MATERYELGVTPHWVKFPCMKFHESIQMDTFAHSICVYGNSQILMSERHALAFGGREPHFRFQQLLNGVRMWIHCVPCMARA